MPKGHYRNREPFPLMILFWLGMLPFGMFFGLIGVSDVNILALLSMCSVTWLPIIFVVILKTRVKRVFEDTPTSQIGTGAIGSHVEIEGNIYTDQNNALKAPLSGQSCDYYFVLIFAGNENDTDYIEEVFTPKGYLYLKDDSEGLAVVYPSAAEIVLDKTPSFHAFGSSYKLAKESEWLDMILKRVESKHKCSGINFRVEEYSFDRKEKFYVFGFAESGLKRTKIKKSRLRNILQAKTRIKADADLQKRFDQNQDGILDPEELDEGARMLAEEIAKDFDLEKAKKIAPQVKMKFTPASGERLYLTNGGEKALKKMLNKEYKDYYTFFFLFFVAFLVLAFLWIVIVGD